MGYLSAYSVTEHAKHEAPCQGPSSWEVASQNHLHSQKNKSPAHLPQFKGSKVVGGLVAGAVGGMALRQSSVALGHVQSRYDRSATSDPLQNVPPGLRPFALQAYKHSGPDLNREIRRGPELLRAPLRPRYFGNVPTPKESTRYAFQNHGYYSPQRPPFAPNVRRIYRAQPPISPYGYAPPPSPVYYAPPPIAPSGVPQRVLENRVPAYGPDMPYSHHQQRLVGMG